MRKMIMLTAVFLIGFSGIVLAENNHINVRYETDEQLSDFVYRMTGNKTSVLSEATSVLQEVGAKVQNRLGMISPGLNFEIVLVDDLQRKESRIAFYDDEKKKIFADPKNVTPGMLSHEMAHAVMCAWKGAIPHEAQEMLAIEVEKRIDEV